MEKRKLEPQEHVYGSECCGEETERVDLVAINTAPGVTSYYRNRCKSCGKLCHTELIRLADSNGVEVQHGDILEVPELPDWHAERYHAVVRNGVCLDIRDMGNNNRHMYNLSGKFFSIGPYWENLDKVTDEDLEYYWGAVRGR